MKNKRGFTLSEILVVVLIVGILSAIAIPWYKKTVEKMKVTDALATMASVVKSEHAWYLEHNRYTDNFSNLNVELLDKDGNQARNDEVEGTNYTYKLKDTGIIAERNNKEYFIYRDYATNQILCSPGTHYICKDLGAFTKTSCENLDMAWANRNSTCYVDEEAKCDGLYPGKDLWKDTYCGYTNGHDRTIEEGQVCIGGGDSDPENRCTHIQVSSGGTCEAAIGWEGVCSDSDFGSGSSCIITATKGGINACKDSKFNGAKCISDIGNGGCYNGEFTNGSECVGGDSRSCSGSTFDNSTCTANYSYACTSNVTFNNNSKCVGDAAYSCNGTFNTGSTCEAKKNEACRGTFNANSRCIANTPGLSKPCLGTYNGTGCCEGNYCPANSPKCRCEELDPVTGKHPISC